MVPAAPVLAPTRDLRGWSDERLLARQAELTAERRRLDAESAQVAAEVARRSARERGAGSLAVRLGERSPEDLLQRITGSTAREVRSLIEVGRLMGGSSDPGHADDQSRPWLDAVTAAVQAGEIAVDAAAGIASGLGDPAAGVTSADLARAAERLVDDARSLGADKIARRARMERDVLDLDGIAAREQQRVDRRSLHLFPQPDGMTKLVGLLDPESAALVVDAFDRVTAPRRHGPRFLSEAERARQQRLLDDPRTTPQLMLDAFVEMVAIAGRADDGAIFGVRAPAVRVHVRGEVLARRRGVVRLEGQSESVSVATAERHICETGIIGVGFDDDGQAVNVGREQRLFTRRQRIGLAARDGGCRFPRCDRPPSWTEAHHIDEWDRDGGRTDLADGVLLCRFHHMYVHNHGWRITRSGAEYFAVPPSGSGSEPIVMPPKMRV